MSGIARIVRTIARPMSAIIRTVSKKKRKHPSSATIVVEPSKKSRRTGSSSVMHTVSNAAANKPERKSLDYVSDFPMDWVVTSNGMIAHMNGIAAGTGLWQRVGRQAYGKSLHIRYNVYPNVFPAPTGIVNVAVVYDAKPTGTTPTYSTIFNELSNTGVSTSGAFAGPNIDNRDRFRILHRKTFRTPEVTSAAGSLGNPELSNDQSTVEAYINLKNMEMSWGGDTTSLADIKTGALYFVGYHSTGTIATAQWRIAVSARLRYTD